MFAASLEEVDWQHGAQQLNDCKYLYIRGVREIEELTLEVEAYEAKLQAPLETSRGTTPWQNLWAESRPIETDESCRAFRLIFERDHMVSYTVLNESYGKFPEPPEEFVGKLFRVFSWSKLLEFTRQTTHAGNELTGPLHHYQLACLNHVLDVICTKPPRISVLKLEVPSVRPN